MTFVDWVVVILAAFAFLWWTRFIYRAGVRWGRTESFMEGYNAHKEVIEQREQRRLAQQRRDWEAYLDSRSEPPKKEENDGTE